MRQTDTRSKLLTAESRGAVRESPLMRARKRGNPETATRTLARSGSSEGAGAPAARAETSNSISKRTELAPLSQGEERLLKTLLSEPMDYIDHPEYHLPDAADRIYGAAEITRPDVTWYRPLMDDFISTRSRGARPPKAQSSVLLTGAQERVLFMKYNFARFSISEIQKQAASRSLTLAEARDMLRWHAIANQYREQLAETNLALVLAMAKRVRLSEVDFADLIGEGNMALMRSVDKFDCGRGFKFSTYACRAILKAFSRHGIKVSTQKKRFGAEYDPALEKSNHLETVRATHERECADEVRHIVTSNKADLSDIEIKVISHRFGLDVELALEQGTSSVPAEPLTLEQVGQVIGVTKERVRQIQNKALEKIRTALQAANPDAAVAMADDIATREGRTPPSAN
ncbi:MAG: polymerase sigma factor SigA [Planctomycetota bacterium]|jgi:RNA polymerase primary sigma factor